MRSKLICLFINLFVCFLVGAQAVTPAGNTGKYGVSVNNGKVFFPVGQSFTDTTIKRSLQNGPITIMASKFYTSSLGFFCQKELELEKAVRFPVRLRLGSVAYTDQMEGKGRGGYPGGNR